MNTRRINRWIRWLLTAGLLLTMILTLAGPASVARAASFVVTNLNDSGEGSLRQAILDAAASPGADTITFSISGTILLGSTLPTISDAGGLTIDGTGRSITISGNGAVRVMFVNTSTVVLTLRNLSVTGGNSNSSPDLPGSGGSIVNFGTLNVTGSTFSGNTAMSEGGAILNGGTLNVTGSTFSENNAGRSGGGVYNGGTMTVASSTFSGNTTDGGGGGIDGGGGIYNGSGTLTLTDSLFSGNAAGTGGSPGCASFSGCDGGGIYNNGGTLNVIGSTFSENNANHWGGGIYSRSMLFHVTDSVFSGNTAIIGGAILSWGTLTVTDSSFLGNIAQFHGGGIENYYDGTLTVTNTTFSENTAGGISINGSRGGGIDSYDTLDVTNSTFSGNTSAIGGGIFAGGTATVTNSTFSGNNAYVSGGIYIGYNSTANLQNTIVANSTGGNCTGVITDDGGNLSWPDTTCPGLNADPLLGLLQDNGGPTQTHALLGGSPAIDAALLANCPSTDQRGVSRPQGGGCDIGAYERMAYNFNGFFQPVDNLPTWNVVQAGVGIPVRFSLGGDYGLDIFAPGSPLAQKIACGSGMPQDVIEETVLVGSSSLSYNAASDTYTYVWKTSKAWANTCRQLNIRLNDGTEHKANFKFVR